MTYCKIYKNLTFYYNNHINVTYEQFYKSDNIDIEKINIVDLVLLSKLENSKSEIRRLVKGNAVKINYKINLLSVTFTA